MRSSMLLSIVVLTALMFAAGGTVTPTTAGKISDCMKGSPQITMQSCRRTVSKGLAEDNGVSTKYMAKSYRKRVTARAYASRAQSDSQVGDSYRDTSRFPVISTAAVSHIGPIMRHKRTIDTERRDPSQPRDLLTPGHALQWAGGLLVILIILMWRIVVAGRKIRGRADDE